MQSGPYYLFGWKLVQTDWRSRVASILDAALCASLIFAGFHDNPNLLWLAVNRVNRVPWPAWSSARVLINKPATCNCTPYQQKMTGIDKLFQLPRKLEILCILFCASTFSNWLLTQFGSCPLNYSASSHLPSTCPKTFSISIERSWHQRPQ